jgi:hypothetical protein
LSQARKEIYLADAVSQIRSGDLLLFRGRGLIASLIGAAGRSEYTHVAKAIWLEDVPFCAEVRELKGGRIVTLASQVAKFPGLIDVFEANPGNRWKEYRRKDAVRYLLRLAGCDYGYGAILRSAMGHLPVVRCFLAPDMNDAAADNRPPYCSAAVAAADRFGGVDPVPNCADRVTEPADLARSPFYRYRFTLK